MFKSIIIASLAAGCITGAFLLFLGVNHNSQMEFIDAAGRFDYLYSMALFIVSAFFFVMLYFFILHAAVYAIRCIRRCTGRNTDMRKQHFTD